MSREPAVPTYILQSDGLFREGLRLILSPTRFRPHACAMELDDLTDVPPDRPVLFIIGVGANQAAICGKIRSEYPLAFIVAVADESNSRFLASALDDGVNAALFSSVSPNALVSTLHAVMDGKLILIDSRLWSHEMQARVEERPSPPLQNEIRQTETPWEDAEEPHAAKQLSTREVAILERIVYGDSNKHVARFFNIAEPTVKAHVKAIFRKIGASNRTQAAIWALNNRLFEGATPHALPMFLHNGSARQGETDRS
jgi:two-component system, NarL family, nitrate/nitrite response regulator NarL